MPELVGYLTSKRKPDPDPFAGFISPGITETISSHGSMRSSKSCKPSIMPCSYLILELPFRYFI